MGGAVGSPIDAGKSSSTEGADPFFGADSDCSSPVVDADSIVASLSRKPASTRSASASVSVFLRERFLWTQSAASSADWSWPMSASNCSRTAADCSGPSMVRAGRTAFSLRATAIVADVADAADVADKADVAGGLSSGALAGWVSAATSTLALTAGAILAAASTFAVEIGRVEIVLSGNADQREQGVASCVSERRSHAARRRRFADGADRPFRRQPLA